MSRSIDRALRATVSFMVSTINTKMTAALFGAMLTGLVVPAEIGAMGLIRRNRNV